MIYQCNENKTQHKQNVCATTDSPIRLEWLNLGKIRYFMCYPTCSIMHNLYDHQEIQMDHDGPVLPSKKHVVLVTIRKEWLHDLVLVKHRHQNAFPLYFQFNWGNHVFTSSCFYTTSAGPIRISLLHLTRYFQRN